MTPLIVIVGRISPEPSNNPQAEEKLMRLLRGNPIYQDMKPGDVVPIFCPRQDDDVFWPVMAKYEGGGEFFCLHKAENEDERFMIALDIREVLLFFKEHHELRIQDMIKPKLK